MRVPRLISMTVSAACVLGALSVPMTSRAASIGGFSVRPAHFDPAVPATRAYFKLALTAGRSFTGQAVVTNSASTPLRLHVDAVDGLTGATSGAVYANRQDPRRGAGAWVTPAAAIAAVPAHASRHVRFTVRVPRGARPGDHLAGLAFQDARARRSTGSVAITEIVRAVVGVEIRVPGPAASAMRLGSVSLRPLPGTRFSSAVIGLTEAGGLLCQPRLRVTLSGQQGTRTVARQLDTLLPGDPIAYPLPWPAALAAGRYTARVTTSHCGPTVTMTTHATLARALDAPSRGASVARPAASASSGMPIWLIAIVGLGGLGVGVAFSRRRRPGPPAPSR